MTYNVLSRTLSLYTTTGHISVVCCQVMSCFSFSNDNFITYCIYSFVKEYSLSCLLST